MKSGDKVLWLYTQPTGWRLSGWVPATVVKITAKRVTIDAELKHGGTKRVSVHPERVKAVQS